MIPRGYQRRVVDSAIKALKKEKNTVIVAATGAGKTVMMGFLSKRIKGDKLFLQHREELVKQNSRTYSEIIPKDKTAFFTSYKKFFSKATFAMVQTLIKHLDKIPKGINLLVIDECHHIAADTYLKIVEAVRKKNPKCLIVGFTATPERSDNKSLRKVFNNICDQVTIKELVALGFLVKPRGFVLEAQGTHQALRDMRLVSSDFGNQDEVASILDKDSIHEDVYKQWRKLAGDRRTIVFCANVDHAKHLTEYFNKKGVSAACIHGGLKPALRKKLIARYETGDIQVLMNVFVLTEGFDCPPTSCVLLIRMCSQKGALIQMVGRGLRTINPNKYKGIKKKDCLILDFGTSLITHGDLEQSAELPPEVLRNGGGECPKKFCPTSYTPDMKYAFPDPNGNKGCGASIPVQTRVCPFCGFQFRRIVSDDDIADVDFTEVDIINASPFRYVDLFSDSASFVATGFDNWVGIFTTNKEDFTAIGSRKTEKGTLVEVIAEGVERIQALAGADDYMRTYETEKSAKKKSRWLDLKISDKQAQFLINLGYQNVQNLSRYVAACHITFALNKNKIKRRMGIC